MKKLILIRHAKADKTDPSIVDHDRWLTPRWERQIKDMWKKLKKLELEIDYIISSTATRAVLTYEWLSKTCDYLKDLPIIFANEIYDFRISWTDKIINIIERVEDSISNIAIIGHNPVFDDLLTELTGVKWLHIPTLWVALIEFEIKSWEDIRKKWDIKIFLAPEK